MYTLQMIILGLLVGIPRSDAEESVLCPYDESSSPKPEHSSYPARLADLELAGGVFTAYVEYSKFYSGDFALTTGAIQESVHRSISADECLAVLRVSVAWENLVPQLSGSLDVGAIFPNPVTLLGSVAWTGTRDIVGHFYGDSITVSRTDVFFFQITLNTQLETSHETVAAYVPHVLTSHKTVLASMDNYPSVSIATTVVITLDRPFKVDAGIITGSRPVSFRLDSIVDVNCGESGSLCRQDLTFVSSEFDAGQEGCTMDGHFEVDVHFVCIGISEEACSLTSATEFFTISVDVSPENLCADVGLWGDVRASLTSWEDPLFTTPTTGFFSGDVAYFKIHVDVADVILTGVHVMELVLDMDSHPSKILVAGGDIVETCVSVEANEASFSLNILTGDGDCFEMPPGGGGSDVLLTTTIQLSYTTFKRKRVVHGTVGASSRVFVVASAGETERQPLVGDGDDRLIFIVGGVGAGCILAACVSLRRGFQNSRFSDSNINVIK